ncbi:MAG: hypothetical protein UY09_C0024G0018 [Parcubacteria group bacterium GW2011_GWA2_47_8]|nr:MAG: hypothetical protein UY09_C0024G0018 [Parcubacteria group bacterium GW2011_GWA2_47_8]
MFFVVTGKGMYKDIHEGNDDHAPEICPKTGDRELGDKPRQYPKHEYIEQYRKQSQC